MTGGWILLHNNELHSPYSLLNVIRMNNSRTIGWVGYVACIPKARNVQEIVTGNLTERDHLEDVDTV
jgi:hypothetical protein